MIIDKIISFFANNFPQIPHILIDIGIKATAAFIVAGFISLNVLFLVWLERKVSAHIQQRLGPMRVGWHGCLQTIADTFKLLLKESIIPQRCDKLPFYLGPILAFVAAFLGYVVIVWQKDIVLGNLNLGIMYFLAVSGLSTLALLSAGWGSNNKYSCLGALRAAAQFISYEVPLILAVIIIAGTLNLSKIVEAQKDLWFIIYQPIGFILFFIAATAETNRLPFDIPEAESELVGGFHTEYSGMKFSFFFLAEYASMLGIAAIGTTLFLGGWNKPPLFPQFIPGWLIFLGKSYILILLQMWLRWTYPRLRVDQLMTFSWKFCIPLGFFNLFVGAILTHLLNLP
jgi:NADH-quinone oxidoreductase subunit H